MRPVDKLFRDKHGKVVVWQSPNAPLWIWMIATVAGWLLHGTPKMIVGAFGSIALAVWAVMEVGWGVSLFRRLLGGVVLVYFILSVA